MNMSLPEKNTSPRRSLYPESYKTARSNMILGVMLWAGVIGILVLINTGISSKPDLGFTLKIFALLTALGIAAALLPTILGAKVLSIWLERSNPTKKSAMTAGAITGAFVISLFTVPMIVWFDFEIDYSFRSIILLLARFHLPIAICAALAGG